MSFLDQISLPLSFGITQGVKPSDRRPGLTDPVLPGEAGADRLGPTYILVVNKQTLSEDITKHIVEIEYEDHEDMFDQLKITLKGFIHDPVIQKTVPIPTWVQGSTIFSEGNIIWVYMGYGADVRLIGGAEVVRREFDYGDDPSCTVVCYEPTHRMANTFAEKAITYTGMRSSDIVKKIGKKSEYSGAIGALFDVSNIAKLPIFTPRAEVQKAGESDWAFLKRMADIRGWQLFTRFDESKKKFILFYGPDVDKQKVVFRYEYGTQLPYAEDNLQSFKPEINTIDQNSEVEIVALDDRKKKKVSSSQKYLGFADGKFIVNRKYTSGNTDFKNKELQNPTAYRVTAFGVSKKLISNRPFKDEGEAKKFVINWARENIKNFIVGEGTVSGNESIQSRQSILFMGLGETFSGTESKPAKWYLTKVSHKISSGGQLVYETKFDARKAIDWLPNDDITATLAALVK